MRVETRSGKLFVQTAEEVKTINVVAAVIIDGGRALAARRGYGDYAGSWEFPGGKIEDGESPEAALVREIREELDAEIVIDRYFDTVEYDYPKFHLSMRCYLCTLAGEDITLLEHSDAKWVGRAEMRGLKWLAADYPIIEKLIVLSLI
jgi:8-oxo-dGTP diphosphatase